MALQAHESVKALLAAEQVLSGVLLADGGIKRCFSELGKLLSAYESAVAAKLAVRVDYLRWKDVVSLYHSRKAISGILISVFRR